MVRLTGSPQIRNAYGFLMKAETEDRVFTFEEFIEASGWKVSTAKAIRSKKIAHLIFKKDGGLKCEGVSKYSLEAFCRLCSQSASHAKDPEKPRYNKKLEGLVIKAREAALAAVQHYNNPTSVFRSGNYIVLMIIAYTSLFHAIFERDGIEYTETNSPKTKDGERYLWDVEKGAKYYVENYRTEENKKQLLAMAENIRLMVPLRNKIEHRFMPDLDVMVTGHCQAMLMNFEYILVQEFTAYYALNTSLSLALQFSTTRSTEALNAIKRFQSAEYEELREYLSQFHKNLPDDIYTNPAFVFRVWLIPKTANHKNSSDLSIEFVNVDKLDALSVEEFEKAIVAIRDKSVEVQIDHSVTHPYLYTDAFEALKLRLANLYEVRKGDFQSVIEVFEVKQNPKFFFKAKVRTSPGQYSNSFVDWIVAEYNKNSDFFSETREKRKSLSKK